MTKEIMNRNHVSSWIRLFDGFKEKEIDIMMNRLFGGLYEERKETAIDLRNRVHC